MEVFKKYIKIILIICILITFIIYRYNKTYNYNSDDNLQTENNSNNKTSNKDTTDTDGDTIPDRDEKNTYKTDPTKKDSDNDGLDDNIEIFQKTNPLKDDTDSDGLLDGKAQYLNNKMIAPTDPNPLVPSKNKGVWKKQIEIEKRGNIPYYLTTFYEYNPNQNSLSAMSEINWNQLLQSPNLFNEVIKSPQIKALTSNILNFRLDNGGIVLHSQTKKDIYNYTISNAKQQLPTTKYKIFDSALKTLKIESSIETWQKQFGYNILYDEVFKTATNNNMRSLQLYFKDSSGSQYVLWIWKGYYLSLGSGAEIGMYKKSTSQNNHWDAVNFEVPMTLNLYNYYSENNVQHIFNWKPTNPQWWITGFNPNYPNVDVTKQVLLGTVNLSQHKDMYNSLKQLNITNTSLIFDDTNSTIWINW